MAITTLVRNDVGRDVNFTVQDSSGTAIDLTSSTILFKMAIPFASTNKINGSCTIVVAADGTCKYTLQSGDTDTGGVYEAELQITYSPTDIATAKMDKFHVIVDLPTT